MSGSAPRPIPILPAAPLAALLVAALLTVWAPARSAWGAEEDDAPILDPESSSVSDWVQTGEVRGSVWKGDAELGYLSTRGNEDTQTLQGRGRIENDRESWRHTGRIDFLFLDDATGTHSESFQGVQKSAYKLSPVDYLFELLKYTRDRAQGFNRQTVEVIGYGRRVVNAESVKLDLESGPGARQTWPVDGGYHAEPIVVVIGELDWDITERINFNEYATVESGESNTFLGSLSALTMNLAGDFSLRSSYEIKHNSQVPEGVKKTDTTTSLTLVYKF